MNKEQLKEFGMKIGIILHDENELIKELSDMLYSNLDYVSPLLSYASYEAWKEAFEILNEDMEGLLVKYGMTFHFPKGTGCYAKIRIICSSEGISK